MLSTEYRLRLEFICQRIATNQEVALKEMIWANKLAKANASAGEMLRRARRQSRNDIEEGSVDDFLNQMDLGDPDPSKHSTGFGSAEEISDWFHQDKTDDWRQRD